MRVVLSRFKLCVTEQQFCRGRKTRQWQSMSFSKASGGGFGNCAVRIKQILLLRVCAYQTVLKSVNHERFLNEKIEVYHQRVPSVVAYVRIMSYIVTCCYVILHMSIFKNSGPKNILKFARKTRSVEAAWPTTKSGPESIDRFLYFNEKWNLKDGMDKKLVEKLFVKITA